MRWDFAPHARLPHLDTDHGRYSLRREGRRVVRAFLNNERTSFVGTTEQVKVLVEHAVRARGGSTDLSTNQIALMAAVLGVSNAGSDHLFEGPHASVTPETLKMMVAGKRPLDVDSVTTQIVSGLCENEEMLDMFLEEARSWVDRLMHMKVEDVKASWPRYAAFVDCVQ